MLYTSMDRQTPLLLICSAHLLSVGSLSVVILPGIGWKELSYFWLWYLLVQKAVAHQDCQWLYGIEMHTRSLSVWYKIDGCLTANNLRAPTTVRDGAWWFLMVTPGERIWLLARDWTRHFLDRHTLVKNMIWQTNRWLASGKQLYFANILPFSCMWRMIGTGNVLRSNEIVPRTKGMTNPGDWRMLEIVSQKIYMSSLSCLCQANALRVRKVSLHLFLFLTIFFPTSIHNMSTFSDTPAIFNLNGYFGNNPLLYDSSYGPFQIYRNPLVDPSGALLNFLFGSDRTLHPQQIQEGPSAMVMGAGNTDTYRENGLEEHR